VPISTSKGACRKTECYCQDSNLYNTVLPNSIYLFVSNVQAVFIRATVDARASNGMHAC
jgi:hypothetical protein